MAGALDDGTCTGCGYGLFLKNGEPNDKVRQAVSRTYAQKVAGKTRVMKFDWKNNPGNFTLVYDMDKSIKEPTIIYTNKKYWYPNGYKLNINPQNTYDVRTNGNYIEVYNGNSTQTVTINIIPNSKSLK